MQSCYLPLNNTLKFATNMPKARTTRIRELITSKQRHFSMGPKFKIFCIASIGKMMFFYKNRDTVTEIAVNLCCRVQRCLAYIFESAPPQRVSFGGGGRGVWWGSNFSKLFT